MKKTILMLALLTGLVSCTNEDTKNDSTSIEKTNVVANIATTNSSTAKNVNRGSIYAWVKDINVTATSTVWNYSKNETYTLVTSGGESNFTINDVAVGTNRFDATTTSFDTNKVYAVNSIATSGSSLTTAQSAITTLKTHNPYAVYSGTTNATIVNNTINTVGLNLTTLNGRIITAFILDDDIVLRNNTYAVVTSSINGVPNSTLTSTHIKNNVVTFEWSDDKSVVGKTITFTINLYDDTTPNKVLNTYTKSIDIIGSTSYSCIYIIDRDKIINTGEDNLVFTFQVWTEVDCEDVYDNDGYNCNGYDKNGKDKNGYNKGGFNDCGWHKAPNVFYNAQQDKDLSDGDSKTKCQ